MKINSTMLVVTDMKKSVEFYKQVASFVRFFVTKEA